MLSTWETCSCCGGRLALAGWRASRRRKRAPPRETAAERRAQQGCPGWAHVVPHPMRRWRFAAPPAPPGPPRGAGPSLGRGWAAQPRASASQTVPSAREAIEMQQRRQIPGPQAAAETARGSSRLHPATPCRPARCRASGECRGQSRFGSRLPPGPRHCRPQQEYRSRQHELPMGLVWEGPPQPSRLSALQILQRSGSL